MMVKMTAFDMNSVPRVEGMLGFESAKGIAPSKIPCGQIYLQKYGLAIPTSFLKNAGSIHTTTTNTIYLI